jgi:hypothetical protein
VSGAFCLDCPDADLLQRAYALPHCLVLRVEGEQLRLLDLRDTERPKLSEALALPDDESVRGLLVDGSLLYRVSAVASAARAGTYSRFYFRRIDVTNPSKPVIGPTRNVPGQLVAVSGNTLYTRELVKGVDAAEIVLHKLSLHGDRIEVEATHSLGDRQALAVDLTEQGQLLVDLVEPLSDVVAGPPSPLVTDQRVLAADTLALLGEARVGTQGRRLARRGGQALYSAGQGYVLMQLTAEGLPERRAYWRRYGSYDAARGLLTEEHVIVQDAGALARFATP